MDRDADLRVADFKEVDLGLSREEAVAEAKRCIQCKKPKCISGCPVGIDIPAFIRAIADEKFQDAVDIIKKTICFLPSADGLPAGNQCQGVCVLGIKNTRDRDRSARTVRCRHRTKEGSEVPEVCSGDRQKDRGRWIGTCRSCLCSRTCTPRSLSDDL